MADKTDVLAVIPARWASTRFPGKVLALLSGRPVILHVLDRVAQAASVDAILVATDDDRVLQAVAGAGYQAALTRPDHPSGSDRIAEALRGRSAGIVLNVQGDEPLIEPSTVDAVIRRLRDDDAGAATVAVEEPDLQAAADPNVVKVVCDARGHAMYFSRAPIPAAHPARTGADGAWLRHVGVYAWRREEFEAFCAAAPAPLERREGLEQLRYLEAGGRMAVEIVDSASPGVDTPDDLARCEALLAQGGPQV